MNLSDQLCLLLQEKTEVFKQFEQETRAILRCSVDEVSEHIEMRAQLIERIDGIDAQICSRCEGEPLMLEAAWNRCDRGDLSAQAGQVYDAAREVFAVARRVQRIDAQVEDRIRDEMESLDLKIRENNRSLEAQAAKYFAATSTPSIAWGGSSTLGKA